MVFKEHDIEWTGEKISRLWEYYQQTSSISRNYFGAHHCQHVTHLIHQKIGFTSLETILDFSCGRGDIINACLPYLKNEQQIFGTDFSAASVDFVNERFQVTQGFSGATWIESFPAPFPDEMFDLIILTEVVEHLDDREVQSLLKETHRLLSPNGVLFITTPNNEDRDLNTTMCPDCGCKFHRWQHLRSWSAQSLRHAVEEYGFRTSMVTSVAWGESALKRLAYKIAARVNMKNKDGLIYIGKKC